MDILDNIETENKGYFPVACPICGKIEGHLYFHRNMEGDERGSMWAWCSASYPNYLEENKVCIDQWINEILFANFTSRE